MEFHEFDITQATEDEIWAIWRGELQVYLTPEEEAMLYDYCGREIQAYYEAEQELRAQEWSRAFSNEPKPEVLEEDKWTEEERAQNLAKDDAFWNNWNPPETLYAHYAPAYDEMSDNPIEASFSETVNWFKASRKYPLKHQPQEKEYPQSLWMTVPAYHETILCRSRN